MSQHDNHQEPMSTSDILLSMFTNEQEGPEFIREYLKASFLSSAVDALYYARHQADLTQAQVAECLHTKQAAIARLEADTTGSMSLRRYVEVALACGMVPLNMTLLPIDKLVEFTTENPDAPRTAELYYAWLREQSEPAPTIQITTTSSYTAQPPTNAMLATTAALTSQDEKRSVQFLEQVQIEQNQRQLSLMSLSSSGEGSTTAASTSQKRSINQIAA